MDLLGGYTLTKLDYVTIALLMILVILAWRYKKSWMKVILLRFVIGAENNIMGNKMGTEKLKYVKNKFRNWLYTKSFILGLLCETLITDKDIEKVVDICLKEAKEELKELEESKAKVAEFAVNEIKKGLYESPSIPNDSIDTVVEAVNKRMSTENGYINAYARYSEKEKAHVGVEFGVKF